MDFTSFIEVIKSEVTKQLGDGYRVRINDVRKNNGVILKGLTVMQDDSNIAPTIYLNNHYEEYIAGKATLPDIANHVIGTYNRNKIVQSVDMQYFLNFEDIRERVIYKLINTEKNAELLEDVPHIEFLDLSIVFQCVVSQEEFGLASILINNAHLRLWDVTADMLYQAAKENTPRLMPYELKGMAEVLCDIMQAENPDQSDHDEYMEQFPDSVSIPIYVLSNKRRIEGAACMLYSNLLSDFAETIDSSFYIIPSSIHELLLLRSGDADESATIKSMIKEVNDTQVSREERLSYSLYYFDRIIGKIVKL